MRFSVDGHEIDYEVRGDGRPIVLLHGLTVDRRILLDACEPVLAAAPGVRRIYLDLPGHGASRGDPARMSADGLVDALATFTREIAGAHPAVLGYSYGGYLAQGLVRGVAPSGLMLVCPVVEPDFGRRTVPSRRVVRRDVELPFSDDAREQQAFDEIAVVQTGELLATFQRVVHPANIAVDAECVAVARAHYAMARPYAHALGELRAPVTIVCGRDDHWVGFEDALRLGRAIRDLHYCVLPDCGHLLPLEARDRFSSLLADWLARI
jgi:pimeloyl-ACP methyl ester carboxylesterase